MAKLTKNQWFAVMKDGDIARDEDGLALMAKTKKTLVDCYDHDSTLEGKTIIKIQFAKFTEI